MLKSLKLKLTFVLAAAMSLIIILINVTVIVIFYQQNSVSVYGELGKIADKVDENTLLGLIPKLPENGEEAQEQPLDDTDGGEEGVHAGDSQNSEVFGGVSAVFVEDLSSTFRGSFKYPHLLNHVESSVVSGDQLKQLALDKAGLKSERGLTGFIFFVKKSYSTGTLVLFSDDESFMTKSRTLVSSSFAISTLGVILSIWVASFIAGKIIKPIKETLDGQHEFISDVSHELKTPLAVINANAEALESEQGENKWVNIIKSESLRMSGLINELLAASKLENPDTEKTFTEVDFSSLVDETVMTFEAMAFEKGVLIDSDIQENIKLTGSYEKLRQLTAILIDNAVKYVNENGSIKVKLFQRFGTVNLLVTNTGSFVEKEDRKRIFERFYRVDESRANDGPRKSYGLGLSIAKVIAEEHEGNITCTSVKGSPDETTFKLTI
jgi:signal transduction histidine kinase